MKVTRFTPLSDERINAIIDHALTRDDFNILDIVQKANAAILEEYAPLIKAYHEEPDKLKFLNDNNVQMARFLNICGVIGYDGEKAQSEAEEKSKLERALNILLIVVVIF